MTNPSDELASAVEILRDIAAMGKKAGSEIAKQWLARHGYPLEEGGYVPGKGFSDEPFAVTFPEGAPAVRCGDCGMDLTNLPTNAAAHDCTATKRGPSVR